MQKSVDLSAIKSELAAFKNLIPSASSVLRKGGKKIDPVHISGNTAVANHIASQEKLEPSVFNYQKLDPKEYRPPQKNTMTKNRMTNFSIGMINNSPVRSLSPNPINSNKKIQIDLTKENIALGSTNRSTNSPFKPMRGE